MNANTQTLESQIDIDGGQMSLANLANINMDDIAAVRFEILPAGNFDFRVEGPGELTTIEQTDPETQEKTTTAVVKIKHVAVTVHALVDKTLNPDDTVGKKHTETFYIKDKDGLGRVKAYLEDSVCTVPGSLQEVLAGLDGHAFTASIAHTRNPKDKDRPYVNLRFAKKNK